MRSPGDINNDNPWPVRIVNNNGNLNANNANNTNIGVRPALLHDLEYDSKLKVRS